MTDDWRTRDTGDYEYLKYILTWPTLPLFDEPITLKCYTWLPGDCDHEENLPCNYEVYLGVHDHVCEEING